MIPIRDYDLPDKELLGREEGDSAMITWVPDRLIAVLGCGSDPVQELNLPAVQAEQVPVLKRPTGGCAVILSPRMFAVSFAVHSGLQMRSGWYFQMLNELIMGVLKSLGVQNLLHAGTSDIAHDGRKVVGSALYRTREMTFYHAVINVAEKPSIIERLLGVPPRMPDYRENRSHSEFVTSLEECGYEIDFVDFERGLKTAWRAFGGADV